MKNLLIVRHAESSFDVQGLKDFEIDDEIVIITVQDPTTENMSYNATGKYETHFIMSIDENILFNRRILASAFDEELETCRTFLYDIDGVSLMFPSFTNYNALRSHGNRDQYQTCLNDLHTFFGTEGSIRDIRISNATYGDLNIPSIKGFNNP